MMHVCMASWKVCITDYNYIYAMYDCIKAGRLGYIGYRVAGIA